MELRILDIDDVLLYLEENEEEILEIIKQFPELEFEDLLEEENWSQIDFDEYNVYFSYSEIVLKAYSYEEEPYKIYIESE